MTKAEMLRTWALGKIGCGYVYGGTGVVCSLAYRQARAEQYPSMAGMILGVAAKWDGKQVFDCAQLTSKAAQAVGLSLPSGASSQWRKVSCWAVRGTIDSLPADRVCILYHEGKSGNPMSHTGIYLGDGMAVDSRGHASGVLHTKLSSYPWTHFGVLEGLYEGEVIVDTQPLLQRGAAGDAVRSLQMLLLAQAYVLPKYGADGDFGGETEAAVRKYQTDHGIAANGIVGEATWTALSAGPAADPGAVDDGEPGVEELTLAELDERIDALEVKIKALESRYADA
jgi:hypothetical protein